MFPLVEMKRTGVDFEQASEIWFSFSMLVSTVMGKAQCG